MMDYRSLLCRYNRLGERVSDLSRIRSLLHSLGDPQERLRFVHIAGTNGKGSVSQMIADALTSAGYRTGLFTSPFILRYNDRIRIDGYEITDAELDELADQVSSALDGLSGGFSQFEITQAMAFLHYVRRGCDVVVLETGLGGLLDSTNVIPPPVAGVITSIALDHTAILGDSVEDIARHKSGIIKPGSRAVMAAGTPREAAEIIRKTAMQCGTTLVTPDRSELRIISCSAFGSEIEYRGRRYSIAMGGAHQITNALTAIETLGQLRAAGMDISDSAVDVGLKAQIPARVQLLSRKPTVILDGGHNPEGVSALSEALATLPCRKVAVIGMLADKDSGKAAHLIAGSCERFICVDGFAPNARPAEDMAKLLSGAGANAEVSGLGAADTVRMELSRLPKGTALVICGSLYLASEVLGSSLFKS